MSPRVSEARRRQLLVWIENRKHIKAVASISLPCLPSSNSPTILEVSKVVQITIPSLHHVLHFTMASLHETIVTPRTQPDAYQQPVWFASGRAPVQLHVQLSLNNHAQCCTITKSLFDKIHGNRPDLPFKDDGHLCKHNKQIRRVRLDVDVYGHAQSAFVTFCVLEGTESLVVMTGREGCWAETSKAVCIVVKEKRKSSW